MWIFVCEMVPQSKCIQLSYMYYPVQWDVLSDKEACDIVRASLESTESALKDEVVIEKENRRDSLAATVAAEALVKASLDAGTMDNVTAVIGVFAWS